MPLEVEQKFRVADLVAIEKRLEELGFQPNGSQRQTDCYYAHPVRDFAQTDEAFRLRCSGDRNVLTYKGPKIDLSTKTRREEEVALESGPAAAAAVAVLLECLGFRPVAKVTKQRALYALSRQGMDVEAALDQVEGVGEFVELEIQAAGDDPESRELSQARALLEELAAQLALGPAERRSYLELLLASR